MINEKIYVGHTVKKEDDSYLGSGKYLKEAVKLFGKDKFKRVTLEVVADLNKVKEREAYWINKLKSNFPEIGYNGNDHGEKPSSDLSRNQKIQVLITEDEKNSLIESSIMWSIKNDVKAVSISTYVRNLILQDIKRNEEIVLEFKKNLAKKLENNG